MELEAAGVRVIETALPDGYLAATNGTDTIWIDRWLLNVERRCALVHEQVHLEAGHKCAQDGKVEAWVRAETARRLIDVDDVFEHLPWVNSLGELADELGVTPEVLEDRRNCSTPEEWERIRELEAEGSAWWVA